MPACYAHTLFGEKVFKTLNFDMQRLIHQYKDFYYIGVLGPDILFYYNALKNNDIIQLGNQIHRDSAYSFFKHAKECIENSVNKEAALVYMIGFVNHFILDSECHPFINEYDKNNVVNHYQIESDLDRELLVLNGFIASKKDIIHHIHYKKQMSRIIAPFFNISEKKMHKSLSDMFLYLSLLHCPNALKKSIVVNGMKIAKVYDSMSGLIIVDEINEGCKESTSYLVTKLDESISLSQKMITEFLNYLNETSSLNKRFDRNFE